ncbi:MAG: hypothetical protein JWN76_2432 [Chitinophagaceae bacterium]|nr:hypothetical protein [Chitinophagaceae bacterium]
MINEHADFKILKTNYVSTAEFYSQVIDSLQDYAILTLDNQCMINSWSAGSANIFGYPGEEIIGKHFNIIFTEEDIQNKIPENEIETALRDGRATDNRWHVGKDQNVFYAYGLVFPLIGLEGEMLGYVKILRDLTERKRTEDAIRKYVIELEELNTHKESVLAILSHDLRSPLAGIITTAEYLRSNFKNMEAAKVQNMLDLLYKSASDELNMLDYLLEWARIKYASDAFSPAKTELIQYVEKVFTTLNDTADLKGIKLHNEIEPNTSVFADGKMLLSIIQNIISNAIKHTGPGGEIRVSSETQEGKVIIQIKDTGLGMSKEIQETLFTPQMHTLSKTRKENKGAGIGLLLVKGFLDKNGGEIWVESIEGKGSSFYFTLPVNKSLYNIDATTIEFDETT